jgi:hypothetical protein
MSLNTFLEKFGTHFDQPHSKNDSYKSIDPLNTFKCNFSAFTPRSKLSETYYNKIIPQQNEDSENGTFELYVQNVSVPGINITSGEPVESVVGTFQTHKLLLTPESSTFTLDIINTGKPVLETFFLPWLREIQSPQWVYNNYPYTKATFEVDMTKHTDVKYVFLGCRPTQIDTINPSHDLPSNITRKVTMTFDFMYVTKIGN